MQIHEKDLSCHLWMPKRSLTGSKQEQRLSTATTFRIQISHNVVENHSGRILLPMTPWGDSSHHDIPSHHIYTVLVIFSFVCLD